MLGSYISQYLIIVFSEYSLEILLEYLSLNKFNTSLKRQILQINNSEKIDNLIRNFSDLNKQLTEEKDEKFKDKYYETLKYMYICKK